MKAALVAVQYTCLGHHTPKAYHFDMGTRHCWISRKQAELDTDSGSLFIERKYVDMFGSAWNFMWIDDNTIGPNPTPQPASTLIVEIRYVLRQLNGLIDELDKD
jgi:hypothetical protein